MIKAKLTAWDRGRREEQSKWIESASLAASGQRGGAEKSKDQNKKSNQKKRDKGKRDSGNKVWSWKGKHHRTPHQNESERPQLIPACYGSM